MGRRRALFPPDRRLQVRMVMAAVLTPLMVVAALACVVAVLPFRVVAGVGLTALIGTGAAIGARRRVAHGRVVAPSEAPELHGVVDRLCVLADLPKPEIVVEAEQQPNSWVLDAPGRPPRLHVTEGLLDALLPEELEAVIAHELSHVAHGDATIMTVVGLPGAVLLEGSGKVRGWFWLQIGALLAGLIGLVASVGSNALSRYRELSADRGAAALTGRPSALASALRRISGELARMPAEDLRAVAGRDAFHLLPVDVPAKEGWRAELARTRPARALAATHPPVEHRIAELERLERRMHGARLALPEADGAGAD